jgi:hypothetical protein
MQPTEKIIEETTSKIRRTVSRKFAKIEKSLAMRKNESEKISSSLESDSEEKC